MAFRMPELMLYQDMVLDFMATRTHSGVFLGMSGGKTVTTLSALAHIRPAGHILVIAPVNIARSTWLAEIEKFGFPLRTKSFIYNDRDKKISAKARKELYQNVFTDPPTMYFISRDLVADLVNEMPIKRVNGKREIQWPFPTVIIDESQGFKNPSAVRFKALKKVRPAISRMVLLTGTPVPNGLLDLWAQVYLLDQGQALGKTYSAYRDTFFNPTVHVNGRPVAWEPKTGAKEEIYRRISHLVMSAENTNIPLPEVSVHDVGITLSSDVMDAYKHFAKHWVLELATPHPTKPSVKVITTEHKAVLNTKLLQFASGTIYTDKEHNYEVVHEEKLEMLDYLIRNNGGSPVIVAYHFASDKAQLMERLPQLGHAVEAFDGSQEMTRRWNESKIPVMLLQPASAAHGLNLQFGGHTMVWYTLTSSSEPYEQANARLVRIGQQNPVQIYRLLTRGTVDEKQPVVLANKKRTSDGLLAAVRHEVYEDIEDVLGDLDISPL